MRWLFFVLPIAACGDDGNGAVDATPVVDIDNGSCGDMLNFTGELVDWDSSNAAFCGVNAAQLAGGNAMDSTSPNGRFEMCIPRTGVTQLAVTPAATNSQCAMPPAAYTLPGLAVADPATILSGAFWSGRLVTTARIGTLGVPLDPAKAHVIVNVEGQQRAVAIIASHAPAQAFDGTAWAAGEVGTDVFFPNVDVPSTGGNTMLTVVGGAIGTGMIPLQAGKLTMVTVLAQ